jgi:hypothetical protein
MTDNGEPLLPEGGSEVEDLLRPSPRKSRGLGRWFVQAFGTILVLVMATAIIKVVVFEYWLPLRKAQDFQAQADAFDKEMNGSDSSGGDLDKLVATGASQITTADALSTAMTSGDSPSVRSLTKEYGDEASAYLKLVNDIGDAVADAGNDLSAWKLDSFTRYRSAMAAPASDNADCLVELARSYTPPTNSNLHGIRCQVKMEHHHLPRFYVLDKESHFLDRCPVTFRKYVKSLSKNISREASAEVAQAKTISLSLLLKRIWSKDDGAAAGELISVPGAPNKELDEDCLHNPSSKTFDINSSELAQTYPPLRTNQETSSVPFASTQSVNPPSQQQPQQNQQKSGGLLDWLFGHKAVSQQQQQPPKPDSDQTQP